MLYLNATRDEDRDLFSGTLGVTVLTHRSPFLCGPSPLGTFVVCPQPPLSVIKQGDQ